jgi:hypothetical protein
MKITYLYAKRHRVTGLRYFGKTTQDPYQYKGSGLHWRRHLRRHGDDVETTWVQAYTDQEILVREAEFFSRVYDIAASSEWANMKPENGLDGWQPGIPNPRSVSQSAETRARKSSALKGTEKSSHFGEKNGMYGKQMSEEAKIKLRATRALTPTAIPWTDERRARVAATWAAKRTASLKQT